MGWFAVAAKAVGSFLLSHTAAISVASTALTAYGQVKQGQAEQAAANSMAGQQEAQAKQERAVAQLLAARQRRAGKSQLSTQQNQLASSGFTSDDPTSTKLLFDTVGAQTLEEKLTLAQGEDTAKQMEFAASQQRITGKQAYNTGLMTGASTLISGGVSWADRYGLGGKRKSLVQAG